MQHLLPRARTETCSCRGQAHGDWRQGSDSVGAFEESTEPLREESALRAPRGLLLQS